MKANFYVVMKDSFLSGWGPAEGKDNILVIHCDTHEEAEIVKNNAKDRTDMENVRINETYPHQYKSKGYFLQDKTKEDMPAWFKKDYFKGDK